MTSPGIPERATERPSAVRPSDWRVILAGIYQFGLAGDRADLQDLRAAFERMEALIVRAVNSHEELIAALEQTVLVIEAVDETMRLGVDATLDRARAALARAKEGGA